MRKLRKLGIHWTAIGAIAVLGLAGCSSTGTEMHVPEEPRQGKTVLSPSEGEPRATASLARFEPVHFELDRWDLGEEARRELASSAVEIRSRPDLGVVTIEGHCDDRGSAAYNEALGLRRAAAVKRHLESLGVAGERLEVVTYGERRPVVSGKGESVWRVNRRSELRLGLQQASR